MVRISTVFNRYGNFLFQGVKTITLINIGWGRGDQIKKKAPRAL